MNLNMNNFQSKDFTVHELSILSMYLISRIDC